MTQTAIFVDPSLAGPDVRFSTGTVVDGAEAYATDLPDIFGTADPGWNITQWATPPDQIFDPATVVAGDPRDTDPLLGAARASWHTGSAAGGSLLVAFAIGAKLLLFASHQTHTEPSTAYLECIASAQSANSSGPPTNMPWSSIASGW